jgi:cytochrome c6
MKRKIFVFATIIVASAAVGVAADAAANWNQLCASCHGKDGSGNTAMGKKLGLKDYSKEQSFSDAEATNIIKNGKGKMKGYKDKLSDADVKALVSYVRSLKK